MSIFEALSLSVLGFIIVFCVLIILMVVIYILSSTLGKQSAAAQAGSAQIDVTADTATPKAEVAHGTAGDVCLFDVPDKEAALIMAIVADKLHLPLNELRFKSIREVKDK